MMRLHPILLCGGADPQLSPPGYFKQAPQTKSLFQDTILRVSGEHFGEPLFVTAQAHHHIVTQQAQELGLITPRLLIEPHSRNTAPALLAAALLLARHDPQALVIALPCDHLIPDPEAFQRTVETATAQAQAGAFILFGTVPRRAEPRFGYIELAGEAAQDIPYPVVKFIEKPDPEEAIRMLSSGHHLWNTGILLARADLLIEAYEDHAPEIFTTVIEAVNALTSQGSLAHLPAALWAKAPDLSLDYALLEANARLSVMPYRGLWTDLGAQDRPPALQPWGSIERLDFGARFEVKRLRLHPGAALALQSHHHRAEHWVVVEGTARVTVDGVETLLSENQAHYVPLGALHRLENPGKIALVLIEVQTGCYLGDDDRIAPETAALLHPDLTPSLR